MEKKSKLRTYRKLKTKLVLENYVVELEREQRRQLTMLRGGTNKLRIETGRRRGECENERICNVCLCKEVEDEKHFILRCPMYVRERVEMFDRLEKECELGQIEQEGEDRQMNILIGSGEKEKEKQIRDIVLAYMRKEYDIRKRYIT